MRERRVWVMSRQNIAQEECANEKLPRRSRYDTLIWRTTTLVGKKLNGSLSARSLSFLSFYIYCAFFIFSIRQRFHSQNLLSFISFMNLYYTLMCYSLCLPSSFESGIKKKARHDTRGRDVSTSTTANDDDLFALRTLPS